MNNFNNVTVIPKANSYFGGKVTSRTMEMADGSRKTLGYMLPGEYEFGTSQDELMELIAGEMEVLLPGLDTWKNFGEGECFSVPANSKFKVKVKDFADYCCSYS